MTLSMRARPAGVRGRSRGPAVRCLPDAMLILLSALGAAVLAALCGYNAHALLGSSLGDSAPDQVARTALIGLSGVFFVLLGRHAWDHMRAPAANAAPWRAVGLMLCLPMPLALTLIHWHLREAGSVFVMPGDLYAGFSHAISEHSAALLGGILVLALLLTHASRAPRQPVAAAGLRGRPR
ncbi:MAG: hypothetical protein ACFB3T_05885 [Geminicoccaceae bacterium]